MGLKAIWGSPTNQSTGRGSRSSASAKPPKTRTSRSSKAKSMATLPPSQGLGSSPLSTSETTQQAQRKPTDPLEKYQILKGRRYNLGRGSFSDVRAAVSLQTGSTVAMKMVKRRYLLNAEERVMVAREIEIQQRMHHKNIIELLDVFEDNVHYYLALECTNHGSLQQLLVNKPHLNELEARALFSQLAEGVGYLHANNVLHGDLKPENVLLNVPNAGRRVSMSLTNGIKTIAQRLSLTRSNPKTGSMPAMALGNLTGGGPLADENEDSSNLSYDYDYDANSIETLEVKICDFGLARWLNSPQNKRATGNANTIPFTSFRGTMGYVSPEILREESCGAPADIWALGVILYEMLGRGVKPFVPYRNCLDMDVEFPTAIWGDRSKECMKLIKDMLSRDPAKRPNIKQVLESAWMMIPKL